MSAQLTDPRKAATAIGPLPPMAVSPHPLPAPESRAAAPEAPRVARASEDVDPGIGLLLRFLGGISVMVGDVLVVGAIDRSWVLIPAFAVLLLTTAVVFAGIMRLLADGAEGHA